MLSLPLGAGRDVPLRWQTVLTNLGEGVLEGRV
jgi:hypothetical protein